MVREFFMTSYFDHPYCQIKIQFSVVGDLKAVVWSFKFDQN